MDQDERRAVNAAYAREALAAELEAELEAAPEMVAPVALSWAEINRRISESIAASEAAERERIERAAARRGVLA